MLLEVGVVMEVIDADDEKLGIDAARIRSEGFGRYALVENKDAPSRAKKLVPSSRNNSFSISSTGLDHRIHRFMDRFFVGAQ